MLIIVTNYMIFTHKHSLTHTHTRTLVHTFIQAGTAKAFIQCVTHMLIIVTNYMLFTHKHSLTHTHAHTHTHTQTHTRTYVHTGGYSQSSHSVCDPYADKCDELYDIHTQTLTHTHTHTHSHTHTHTYTHTLPCCSGHRAAARPGSGQQWRCVCAHLLCVPSAFGKREQPCAQHRRLPRGTEHFLLAQLPRNLVQS